MSLHEEPSVTSAEVLNRIRSEIDAPSVAPPDSTVAARVARIHGMQRDLRIEPLGGRLMPVKRLVHWFVASTFDRQAKVVEALLDVVRDIGEENEQLRTETERLQNELRELHRTAGNDREPGNS